MKPKLEMVAQGDLLFIRRESIPAGGEIRHDGVIATGETTGHTHRLRPGQQVVLRMIAGVLWVQALKEATVEHVVLPMGRPTGEHDGVLLSEGLWEVRPQQEWSPEGLRRVAD